MKNNFKLLFFFIIFCYNCNSQIVDSLVVEVDSLAIDSVLIVTPENSIKNPNALASFFLKLYSLKNNTNRKVNIVHVGDSHIQADLMTGKTRKNLQKFFGNGGRGFVFPHNLARTNGSWDIRFTSNANWDNHKIISLVDGSKVGLSGIALSTKSKDFLIELDAKEIDNYFNTVKIITPNNENNFNFSTEKYTIAKEIIVPKKMVHKIKSGEVLSIIAEKYNVGVVAIKKANGLKSNNIKAGKTLKIPTKATQIKLAEHAEFIPLKLIKGQNYHFYKSEIGLQKIYIIPNNHQNQYDLNGLILENDTPGILYHNIGVNGAKFSDYNKYPLFFEQLKALEPDVLIVSLGTNESFDKMNGTDYMNQLDLFIQNAKAQNPMVEILIITPPPSLFQRKYPNVFVADYAQKILNIAAENNYAVWDMYSQLGGLYGVNKNHRQGLMANDKVHYSKKGYEKQGDLLSEAIIKTFEIYKNLKK